MLATTQETMKVVTTEVIKEKASDNLPSVNFDEDDIEEIRLVENKDDVKEQDHKIESQQNE